MTACMEVAHSRTCSLLSGSIPSSGIWGTRSDNSNILSRISLRVYGLNLSESISEAVVVDAADDALEDMVVELPFFFLDVFVLVASFSALRFFVSVVVDMMQLWQQISVRKDA